jgi:DNA-binding CsgD family transcriptional regulator
MILQYTDIFEDGKICKIKAEITTEHNASSYGMPVVVLPEGHALDAQSWVLLNYQIVSLSRAEEPMMRRWLDNLYAMLGMAAGENVAASILGRKGGSAKSEAKTRANKNKGQGRPPGSGGLTALQREAYELRSQGLSIREIAQRMGRNPENVRQLVSRAATKLGIPGGWTAVGKKEEEEK